MHFDRVRSPHFIEYNYEANKNKREKVKVQSTQLHRKRFVIILEEYQQHKATFVGFLFNWRCRKKEFLSGTCHKKGK